MINTPGANERAARHERVEVELMTGLPRLLSAVSFAETVAFATDQKPPRDIDRYEFVAVANLDGRHPRTQDPARFVYKLPAGIDEPSPIGLATRCGIGAVKRNAKTGRGVLLALAAAYVDYDVDIRVTQMQGARGGSKGGLGGFNWQQSLLLAWWRVAEQTEASNIIMEAGVHNQYAIKVGVLHERKEPNTILWLPDEERERLRGVGGAVLANHQDRVANELGFSPNERGDWVMPLHTGIVPQPRPSLN